MPERIERDRFEMRNNDRVSIRDFPGLALAVDPLDALPGSSRDQVNVVPTHPGELRVRRGIRFVRFDG